MERIISDLLTRLIIIILAGIALFLSWKWVRRKLAQPAITVSRITKAVPNPIDIMFPLSTIKKAIRLKSGYITDAEMRERADMLLRQKRGF